MKVSYCSDLHTEYGRLVELPNDERADVLVLAGDIVPARNVARHVRTIQAGTVQLPSKKRDYGRLGFRFLKQVCEAYPLVLIVPGNHESYGGCVTHTLRYLDEVGAYFGNLKALDNRQLELTPGLVVFGATMWTRISPVEEVFLEGPKGLNDFAQVRPKIRFGPGFAKFRAGHAARIHEGSRQWLDRALGSVGSADRKLVVTHHAPCSLSVPARWQGHPVNVGYVSDLTNLMLDHEVAAWVHGHIHDEVEYQVGDTYVLANPRGTPKDPCFSSFRIKSIDL